MCVKNGMTTGRGWLKSRLSLVTLGGAVLAMPAQMLAQTIAKLPDAPSAVLIAAMQPADTPMSMQISQQDAKQAQAEQSKNGGEASRPCPRMNWGWKLQPEDRRSDGSCNENPLQMVVQTGEVAPLTPTGKAVLAGRNIIDPFNLITITGYSAVYVAFNSHSPYGPGFNGFGRLVGYSLAEDVQGEFFGVYAIPSLAHEDPRYHRLPGRSIKIRLLHAVAHTVLSQHDDGSLMPNYATLLTYPISAELSNAYVPGLSTTGSATRNRILLGYATDPASALIAEFLPDVAKHVHVRVVFVQQILNQIATRSGNQP
jgi:hypothetical protein